MSSLSPRKTTSCGFIRTRNSSERMSLTLCVRAHIYSKTLINDSGGSIGITRHVVQGGSFDLCCFRNFSHPVFHSQVKNRHSKLFPGQFFGLACFIPVFGQEKASNGDSLLANEIQDD